jgi:hypothetical protein
VTVKLPRSLQFGGPETGFPEALDTRAEDKRMLSELTGVIPV